MADNNFKPKPRDKNLLDSKRIVLSVPCPVKGVKGFSELHYYANNDNPGITVYTRDPADKDNNFGRIQAKFGILDLQCHLEQLKIVLDSKEPIKLAVECESVRGQDKKRVPVARVEVGKRPDGVVYILVEDLENNRRPIIHFPITPTYWHKLSKNGQPCTEAEVSITAGRALYNLVSQAMVQVSVKTYKHPDPKPQNGNGGGYGGRGGGNGYNNRNGGGGGYNRNDDESDKPQGGYTGGFDDTDDDIPF